MRHTKKLGTDCTEELYELVQTASKVERRNVSSFIRIACEDRAKKILNENGKITNSN